MNVALVIVGDRGDLYLPGMLQSLEDCCVFEFSSRILIDDSDHRLGMAGAVREGWRQALEHDTDFVFHVEEDFRFVAPVHVPHMAGILQAHPRLAQVVLKRQAWSPEEHAAGGIIEKDPHDYHDEDGHVAHWRIFSLNPCLIPRRVCEFGWDDDNEAGFTRLLLERGYHFAFYGGRCDPPRVIHVGAERSSGWRL